jgi:hypothetical protein
MDLRKRQRIKYSYNIVIEFHREEKGAKLGLHVSDGSPPPTPIPGDPVGPEFPDMAVSTNIG